MSVKGIPSTYNKDLQVKRNDRTFILPRMSVLLLDLIEYLE